MTTQQMVESFLANGGAIQSIPLGERAFSENEIREMCDDRRFAKLDRAEKIVRESEERMQRTREKHGYYKS